MTSLIKNIVQKKKIFDKLFNNKTILICLLISLLFFGKTCFATMAASGPALNEKTKQCGYFYGGDEEKLYHIPNGWKVDFQSQEIVEKFKQCGWYTGEANIEKCCEKIGYNFIEGNIANIKSKSDVVYLVIVVLFFLILIIFLAKRRTKTK